MIGREQPTLPVTLAIGGTSSALKVMPVGLTSSMPSSCLRKSRCQKSRRNSPSVIDCRPISSWRFTAPAMQRSSTSFSFPGETFEARASRSSGGRSRLPTWSAWNGGRVMRASSRASLAFLPAGGRAREAGALRRREIAAGPAKALHAHFLRLDVQHVEGIGLAAPAHRGSGAGLHHERGVIADLVARGGVAGVARVQMAGEQDVGAAGGEHLHRLARTPDKFPRMMALGQVERMMRHHDLGDARVEPAQPIAHALDLRRVDAAALEHARASGVHADDRDFIVDEGRLHLRGNVTTILGERLEEALEHVVVGDVVVAGHDQQRTRQRVEKAPGVAELGRLGALRQVAGYRYEMGPQRLHPPRKRRKQRAIDAPEVQIREVHQHSHGAITCSAPGRIRYSSGISSAATSPSVATSRRLCRLSMRRFATLAASKSFAWWSRPKSARKASSKRRRRPRRWVRYTLSTPASTRSRKPMVKPAIL